MISFRNWHLSTTINEENDICKTFVLYVHNEQYFFKNPMHNKTQIF